MFIFHEQEDGLVSIIFIDEHFPPHDKLEMTSDILGQLYMVVKNCNLIAIKRIRVTKRAQTRTISYAGTSQARRLTAVGNLIENRLKIFILTY